MPVGEIEHWQDECSEEDLKSLGTCGNVVPLSKRRGNNPSGLNPANFSDSELDLPPEKLRRSQMVNTSTPFGSLSTNEKD